MANYAYDLLLKGATVIDPKNNINEKMDVAVKDKKIAAVDKDIDPALSKKTITLSENLIVVPGLIDMHCHLCPTYPVAEDGLACIHPEAHLFQAGVTTAVDAGTCGIRDFVSFKENLIDKTKVRVLAMINIADGGMVNLESEQRLSDFRPKAVAGMAESFRDTVVAVKTAHYWVGKPFTKEHPAWASVDATLEAARLCGLRAMFDFQPTLPERSYQDLVLKKLAPGDIHTHMYAQQFPVIDENGKVSEFLFEARARGVLFDLGHGAGSFWFRNAVPALEQGFAPDVLSTDLYFDNVAGPVYGLTHIMSKYLSMGMPLTEIIRKTTVAPAEILGHTELGTLSVGKCADITVLDKVTGTFGFSDAGRARMTGDKKLVCEMTIRNGEIVYDINARANTDWENAPEEYWHSPGVIKD